MTDKTKYHIAYFFLIIFSAISVIWAVYLVWGARGFSFERSFVYQAAAKESITDSGGEKNRGVLDSPFIRAKSNPFGPGASIDLAASTRPKGDWKTGVSSKSRSSLNGAMDGANPPTPTIKTITAYSRRDSCHYPVQGGCLTASGKLIKEGMAASNQYPFGAKLLIDGKVYVVEDRMAKRYSDRIDLFFEDYQSALRFGKQRKQVLILK